MHSYPTFGYRIFRLMAVVLLLSATASAQSLGEMARRHRAKKGKQAKATRVYTNEDLPSRGGLSTGVPAETKAKEGKTGQEGEQAPPKGEDKKTRAEVEKEYRAKAAQLHAALAAEEKKLAELRQGWLLGRGQEVQQQEAAVEKARKSIEDLEEKLRRSGLPPGWAR